MIGANVDLDLLSLFLKYEQESWSDLRERELSNVNNGGEQSGEEGVTDFGEEDSILYPFPKCYRCFRDRAVVLLPGAVLLLRAVVPLLRVVLPLRLTKLNPKQHET